MEKIKYKSGILDRDHDDMGRLYLKGTPVKYYRSKDYEELEPWESGPSKWTGQFRTHYICKDSEGNDGSFTIFWQKLFIQ